MVCDFHKNDIFILVQTQIHNSQRVLEKFQNRNINISNEDTFRSLLIKAYLHTNYLRYK